MSNRTLQLKVTTTNDATNVNTTRSYNLPARGVLMSATVSGKELVISEVGSLTVRHPLPALRAPGDLLKYLSSFVAKYYPTRALIAWDAVDGTVHAMFLDLE